MIITISRTYGSGGKEIGKALADRLNIKYYGREIFEMTGGEKTVDDESIGNLETTAEIFKQQSKTITEIANREECVIVGRCADYVLRDMDNVVNIYLYAPLKDCMRRVKHLYELNPEDAKSLIHSMNKTRGDYYFHNTGCEWSDPLHYDLCLNTSGLNTEKCVDIIMNYIQTRNF